MPLAFQIPRRSMKRLPKSTLASIVGVDAGFPGDCIFVNIPVNVFEYTFQAVDFAAVVVVTLLMSNRSKAWRSVVYRPRISDSPVGFFALLVEFPLESCIITAALEGETSLTLLKKNRLSK